MSHDFTATAETFWIAHDEGQMEHGILAPQERVSTGLAYLETYSDPREWNMRLVLLRKDYDRAVEQWLETLRLRDPLARLADYRWRKETGGVTLASGVRVSTTRESQSMISSTLAALAQGLMQEPVHWKSESGWIDLTEAELRAVAAEVVDHVNRCFRAEERVAALLADDYTIDIEASFDAAYKELQ